LGYAVYLPHPALEKGGLAGLPGSVQHPVQFILYVAVQLSTHETFLRGKHIMSLRVTGAGGVKKSGLTMVHDTKYTSKG
jgi:hypothetical protein